MKKKIILSIAVLVVAGAAAFWYYRSKQNVQVVTVVTAISQQGYIAKTITATGNIQPVDSVAVGAQVSGVVKAVYVDYNSVVKKGQLLAKIDETIAAAQAEQSKASLTSAKSNRDFQQSNFDRQDKLYNLGAISKADYQIAINGYNNAKATVNSAVAQLSLSERNLSLTNIYSPIDGVVLTKSISAGQTIASSFNAPTLFGIAKDLSKMQVQANIDEADIGGVKPDQNVTFTVDAFPNAVFEGVVRKVLLRASVSSNVVSYATYINVDNKDMRLKPGMTASINVYIEEDSAALLVPSKALTFKPDSVILKGYKIKRADTNRGDVALTNKGKTMPVHDTTRRINRDTTNKINHDKGDIIKSTVWIKTGDTLTERRILTTMNDGSYAKVVRGLSPNEEVVTNILSADKKSNSDKSNKTETSPFMPKMPQRPGRGRN
jgi:HlyD family secretion protein